jgi:hypothetical protein
MESLNALKYNFADFTFENYRNLLRLAKEKYVIRTFTDFRKDERFVIWRHDVDASLQIVRSCAEIDIDEGVTATCFVNLHSEFYNLLERADSDCVRDILGMGHKIGLHFDAHYYDIVDENQLERFVAREKNILEEFFNCQIQVFSFHNTTPAILECRQWQYAGLINTYAEYFQTQVRYCSDSGGYWRFRRLEDVLRETDDGPLQVLTHPELWTEEVTSPKQRVDRLIEDRGARTHEWYRVNLEERKQENIDWK